MGVKRFTDLRAWQACVTYKRAVYRTILESTLSKDWTQRDQLERSVAAPAAHVAEGYGRFSPPDFARFLVIARSSLMESQNHLIDAVDKGHVPDSVRLELNALAEVALEEVTGLMEYLQSPDALRNARRARERRVASRQERLATRPPRTTNTQTANAETPNPGTVNRGTPNAGTKNDEPRTEPEPEHEPRSEKAEG